MSLKVIRKLIIFKQYWDFVSDGSHICIEKVLKSMIGLDVIFVVEFVLLAKTSL